MPPRARQFYVIAVVASVVSCSILIYLYNFGLPQPVSALKTQSPVSEWDENRRYAYATFLGPPTSKNDSNNDNTTLAKSDLLQDPYFTSIRLLNYQIKYAAKTKSKIGNVPFLVLVLPQVPAIQISKLAMEGATMVNIEPLDLPDAFDKNFIENSRFRDVLSKLRLWQLTDYDKILYLDADSFLLDSLDDIFTDPDLSTPSKTTVSADAAPGEHVTEPPETYLMAASSDTYGDQTPWEEPGHVNYLCACFMLFAPSTALFNYYIAVLTGPDAPKDAWYPEQDLLIQVHRKDGPMPWKRIPIHWSANDGDMNDELALLAVSRACMSKAGMALRVGMLPARSIRRFGVDWSKR